MKKVLVAEIGQSTIVLNAFGDLDNGNPKLLGQVVVPSGADSGVNTRVDQGLKKALFLLEEKVGPVECDEMEVYRVTSLNEKTSSESGLEGFTLNGGILCTSEAIQKIARLLLEEVGDVLILDVGGSSTGVFLAEKNQPVLLVNGLGIYRDAYAIVKRIGESDIKSRYGEEWRSLVQPIPKTAVEITFGMEIMAQALHDAVLNFCSQGSSTRDLTHLRWVIGTGGALTNLPGGMEIIKEALTHCREVSLPEDGFPVLIDQYNILASLGALTENHRKGAWQLLLESLGVDG